MNDTKAAKSGESGDRTPDAVPTDNAATGHAVDGGENPVPRLHSSIVRIRNAMAERQDAFENLREQERILLHALAEELQAFAEDIPLDDEWVLLSLSNGERPRYWVDPTSHVSIDRDRRTYRFLRDTRLGRIVVREGEDVKVIAQCIADYIAERMVERERAVDGDWLAAVQTNYDEDTRRKDEDTRRKDAEIRQQNAKPAKKKSGFGVYLAGLISGMIVVFGIWAFNDPAVVDPIRSLFASVLEPLNTEMQGWFKSQ